MITEPVKFRTLLNGAHFRFKPDGASFERLKSGFRTHPVGDNGIWYPMNLDELVYPVKAEK